MSKEENVINFYVLCNKLKNLIRTGWKYWDVQKDRIESVAEHIYGVQMLALAMKSEYEYDVDIMKVIIMLAVHELEEIYIGDIMVIDKSHDNKKEIGHMAVEKIVGELADKNMIKSLVFEFDERKTKEAIFAYQCDKFEADLQCMIYTNEGCIDYKKAIDKKLDDEKINLLLNSENSFLDAWLKYDQEKYQFDEHFKKVSNYILEKNKKEG